MDKQTVQFSWFWRGHYFTKGGPVTQIVSQRIGAIFAWLAYKVGFSPNCVTILAGVVSLTGAFFLANAHLRVDAQVITLLLLQIGYGLDCADGQLARATGRTSAFGAWLDVFIDAVVINAISCALVFVAIQADANILFSLVAIFLLNSARIAHLHSVPAKKQDSRSNEKSLAAKYLKSVKQLAWMIIDTPVFLLLIVVFLGFHNLMLMYLLVMALLYFLAALNNATVLSRD